MKKSKIEDAPLLTPNDVEPDAPGAIPKAAREKLSSGDVETDLKNLAKTRTKSGKVSKVARDAQDQIDMMAILEPTLGALNELAADRWPDFIRFAIIKDNY